MQDIEQAINQWVKLWNTYDVLKVPKLFLNDERVTYLSSEKEGLIKSIGSLIEHHKEFGFVEGGKDTGNKLWLENIDVESFGSSVIMKADWLFKRKDSKEIQHGPVTITYLKSGKSWLITHAHFSNY